MHERLTDTKGPILTAIVAAVVALAGCADSPTHASPAPAGGKTRVFDVYVNIAAHFSPLENKTIDAFAFSLSPDGPFTVPGPTIRVTQGDHVRVNLHDGFHTMHWHGYAVPWAMDGVPYMTQTLGDGAGNPGAYTYEFDAKESGTYWYHCHVDAPVHIDAGMFGAFIVDPVDKSVDSAYSRDYTLMLHETDSAYFDAIDVAGGTHEPSPGDVPPNPQDAIQAAENGARNTGDIAGLIAGSATGQYGGSAGPRSYYPADSLRYRPQYDTFMINGKSYPDTAPLFIKTGETIRIRLINAGQLLHTMHLHGTHFLVTHKDGYLLSAPYKADSLVIGPGERYDIYVTGDNPGLWDFHDHGGAWNVGAYAANDHAFPGGMNTMLVYEDFKQVDLPHPLPATSGAYASFAPSSLVHVH